MSKKGVYLDAFPISLKAYIGIIYRCGRDVAGQVTKINVFPFSCVDFGKFERYVSTLFVEGGPESHL